eukprot:scaffold66030_cov53-Phaeocystis_antarctica.AAC.3
MSARMTTTRTRFHTAVAMLMAKALPRPISLHSSSSSQRLMSSAAWKRTRVEVHHDTDEGQSHHHAGQRPRLGHALRQHHDETREEELAHLVDGLEPPRARLVLVPKEVASAREHRGGVVLDGAAAEVEQDEVEHGQASHRDHQHDGESLERCVAGVVIVTRHAVVRGHVEAALACGCVCLKAHTVEDRKGLRGDIRHEDVR